MQTGTYIKVILFFLLIGSGNGIFAAITIDSVSITPSNCANDGSITVYARSPSSMVYAIVSGPDIRLPQSGNQFGALPIGSYQIRVTNFSNDTALVNAIVGGTYQFPDFAPTFTNPFCAGSATGIIKGNANAGSGRAPYTWVLTNIGTSAVVTQSSDSFPNLVAGNYRLRMYDSCQAFATRFVTLTDPNTAFTVGIQRNTMLSCDSVEISFILESQTRTSASPYTVTVVTSSGTFTRTFNATFDNNGMALGSINASGVSFGGSANILVVNACGDSAYVLNAIANWNYTLYFPQQVSTCGIRHYYTIDFWAATNTSSSYFANYPFALRTWDSTSNVLFDSTTLEYGMPHIPPLLTPGHLYSISISDLCGNNIVRSFVAPIPDTPRVYTYVISGSCKDSTASVHIEGFNFNSRPVLTFLSGPPVAQSSHPYFSYRDTITYPVVHDDPFNGCTGYSPPSTCYQIGGLPVGTYQYTLHDTCGNLISGSFTVRPQDIAAFAYRKQITRGCPGQNKINYDLLIPTQFLPGYTKIKLLNATAFFDSSAAYVLNIDSVSQPGYYLYRYSGNYTFNNLNAGTYVLESLPRDNSYSFPYVTTLISFGMSCLSFHDTIVIPPYQQPRIDYTTQTKCNGLVNVGLVPDSATGVPPYYYEIISGPQTSGIQYSPFFQLTQRGNYVARISDTCGFARTFSFYVDTLSFQQVVKVGSSCLGNSAILVCEHSPYATYVWQKPDGSFLTGDSLHISPVTAADYGIYQIRKIVVVNNCTDTFYASYTLNSSSVTHISASICNGGSYVFAGNSYTIAGTYYDTIPTAFCDSFVVLTLSVGGIVYDSVSQTICAGQSFTRGTHTYSATGIYRDTVTTGGCDSVFVLNLSVENYKRDSIVRTICAGETFTVGTNIYSSSGIYRDTFSTTTCDSVFVLNLSVENHKRDSIARTICAGETFTIGTNTYSTTGIYRDTFSTTTCDSVFVLNLSVENYKRDSIARTICAGETFTVGANIYSSSGIYRDTFSTTTCDSVFVLNLSVENYKRDSIARTICAGETFTVGANIYSSTGIYRDTISSATCDSILTLRLVVLPAKSDTVSISFCEGESVTLGNQTYSQPGVYTKTISTFACDSLHTVVVSTFQKPSIEITASATDVEAGDTVQLNATQNSSYSYLWTSVAEFNNAYISNPIATVSQSVWVFAQVSDTNNCSALDSVFIQLNDCVGNIYVPNAFTPNGDGNNDVFYVYGKCIRLNRFYIFNRWGEKMWETDDITQGWNGYYKNAPQPIGVYVYLINYSSGSGVGRSLKGSLTLIR